MRIHGFTVVAAFALLTTPHPASAHELNTSYTDISLQEQNNALYCNLILDVTDLEKLFELDVDDNGEISDDEIELGLDDMSAVFNSEVEVSVAGDRLALQPLRPLITHDDLGNTFVTFRMKQTLDELPWRLHLRVDVFDHFNPMHKNLVKVTHGGETLQAILTTDYREQSFSFEGERSIWHHAAQFLWLGMEHIFIGYDHIMFILGLILIGGKLMNLVKMVTAFTVAHSITLVLAVLQVVALPARLVESVIALSIVYIALENFFVKDSDQRWLIAFVFGLMHGFGFAGVLTELGLPSGALVTSLVSFNVGVEIGQVVIVAACYPVIVWVTQSTWQRRIVYGLSSLILVFGLVWFLERALALQFTRL